MIMRTLLLWGLVALGCVSVLAADKGEEEFLFAKRLLLDRQEFDSAVKKLDEFVKEYPRNENVPEALYYMGYCYAHLGRTAEAADAYARLLALPGPVKPRLRQEAMKYGGDAYFKLNKHDKAAEFYSALLKEFPQSPYAEEALYWRGVAYDRIGIAFREAGKQSNASAFAGKAMADFAAFVKRYPASKQAPAALRNAGFVALDSGRAEQAASFFKSAVEMFPDDPRSEENQFYWAESLYRVGKYDEARAQYDQVLTKYPTGKLVTDARSGMAWCDYEVARQLQAAGKQDEAIARILSAAKGFEEVAALAGKNVAKVMQARYDAGRAYREAGNYEKAVELLRSVAASKDSSLRGSARFNMGAFRLEQAKRVEEKINAVDGDAQIRDRLARQHAALLKEAMAFLADAVDDPTIGAEAPEAATFLGEAYLDTQEYDKAEAVFARIVKEWPKDERAPLALYHLALARREQDKLEEAADAIRDLIRNYPKSRLRLKAAYVMADYQAARGELEKSRAAYTWIVKNGETWAKGWRDASGEPDPSLIQTAQDLAADCLFRLGESYYLGVKDFKTAEPYYRKVLSDHAGTPSAAMAALRLAEIDEAGGNLKLATEGYARVLMAGKGTSAYKPALYQMGVAMFGLSQDASGKERERKLAEARRTLEQFVTEFPDDEYAAQALYYLGEINYAGGQFSGAVKEYIRSLELAPEGRFADAALYGLGWSYRELGDAGESRKAFARLLKTFPKSSFRAEALYLVAVSKHEEGASEAALADLETLLSEYPDSSFAARAMIEKGRVLDSMGQHDKAIDVFSKFAESYPKHEERPWALYSLSYAWWHKVEPKLDSARKAAEDFRAAQGDARDNAKKRWETAVAEARALEDKMADVLKQLTDAYPDYRLIDGAWLRWGEVAYDRQQYDKALERYQKALAAASRREDKSNAPKAQYRIGWCHWRLAEEAGQKLTSAQDATGQTKLKKALADHRAAGEAAFMELAKTFAQSSLATEALFRAAELRRNMGKHAEALQAYWSCLDRAEKTGEGKEIVRAARYGLGVSLLETGKDKEALAEFVAFLKAFPGGEYRADANWGAGQASFSLQAYADAAKYYTAALELDDESEAAARSRLGLGMIALQKQQWELAREEFLKVDAFHSRWPTWAAMALLKSSEAARRLGQPEKANADLKRIVDRYGMTPAADEARTILGTDGTSDQ